MTQWLLVVVGYIIGSLPTAYIFGKRLKGRDIRGIGRRQYGRPQRLPRTRSQNRHSHLFH